MITLIEAQNFRCLRYVKQRLGNFHVLVGPNASGKTTFLDVIAFLGRFVSDGPDAAVQERTSTFQDLVWGREGDSFEVAIEAAIPNEFLAMLPDDGLDTVRYEVAIGLDRGADEVSILAEKVLLKKADRPATDERTLFPCPPQPPQTITMPKGQRGTRTLISKVSGGNDNFYSEVYAGSGKRWAPAFKLGPHKSALGNLPEDETKFPVVTWLKRLLAEGVQPFVLNSLLIRKASPPARGSGFRPDGSNLPWVIEALKKDEDRFRLWLAHLRTALPDIADIRTVERPDDKHRYLAVCYGNGLDVPSWVVSDGTLRLLALTLPAYLSEFRGVYLVEEPENGLHPRAVATMYQSLSSVYHAQMLLATHSPVVLSAVDADRVLCFKKTPEGATDIVLGSEHPALRDWQGETNLGTLFASGVLG
jgi:predicted ATPase